MLNDAESIRFSFNPISKEYPRISKTEIISLPAKISKDLCQLLGLDWQSVKEYTAKSRLIEVDDTIGDLRKSDAKQEAKKSRKMETVLWNCCLEKRRTLPNASATCRENSFVVCLL